LYHSSFLGRLDSSICNLLLSTDSCSSLRWHDESKGNEVGGRCERRERWRFEGAMIIRHVAKKRFYESFQGWLIETQSNERQLMR
jgi:hypothetical protein